MKKKWLFVVVPFIVVVLLGSCSLFAPDYVGTWTATVGEASITMEFTKTAFSVTIDTIDSDTGAPQKHQVSGDLAESATAGELDAYITAVILDDFVLDAALMEALFFAPNNLTADQTFTYSVDAETMTISGALLLALTQATSITATAT